MNKKDEQEAKKILKLTAERDRLKELMVFEEQYKNYGLVCGIDEAGRGPFAGPVVAGAVVLDLDNPEHEILYLNDSKKLSEKKRESIYKEIIKNSVAVGIGYSGAKIIDEINILQATYRAMRMAINNLRNVNCIYSGDMEIHDLVKALVNLELKSNENPEKIIPGFILADAVKIPEIYIPQMGIVKGDAKSVSIAAGSIIAKVTRDHIMYEYDKLHPEYGFASHKGYGTKAHIEAIKEHGMLDIHRRSFIHF